MASLRLDKFLSHSGFGARKQIQTLLQQKKVCVNDTLIFDVAFHIDPQNDVVKVENNVVNAKEHIYLMQNKKLGTVCEAKSNFYPTVFDDLPLCLQHSFSGGNLHAIGRLDLDTTGLLLLTTDGALTHRLISPKTHIPKTYKVGLKSPIEKNKQQELKKIFLQGFEVFRQGKEKEFFASPSELEFSSPTCCTLTIYEGKFHQVKRMFLMFDCIVEKLMRIKIGDLYIDETLPEGKTRELTKQELSLLA